MKAESFIFTGLQKPLTVFGLPPMLLVASASIFCATFTMLLMMDLAPLSLPLSLTLFVSLIVFFYRRTRQDHHFFSLLTVPPRFWRGRKHRRLIAGRPVVSSGRRVPS